VSWLTDIARPEIRALKAYEHASWEPGLVRLHANELPWRAAGDASEAGLNCYPEPHPQQLMNQLADYYAVPRGSVLAGRGSDEAIDLLIRSYCRAGQDSILITPPTFGMYGVAARIQGAAVLEVPLRREQSFELDFNALRAALSPGVRLVFLCSPNNPTGNLLSRNALLTLAHELEGRALLVVDEAYIEFADHPSLVSDVASCPALAILRTLSKAHGLAGARCGALIAQPEVIQLLQKVIQPYAVTQLTIEAVQRSLSPVSLQLTNERLALIKSERARLQLQLSSLPGVVQVWPSAANFLLVEWRDAGKAMRAAHAAGLLVRDFSRVHGLEDALRISIGTSEQNARLLASLA
jgi:histidinol-phosphate aminotransferase